MERAVGMHYGNALDHLEWYSVMEVQELAWVSKADAVGGLPCPMDFRGGKMYFLDITLPYPL